MLLQETHLTEELTTVDDSPYLRARRQAAGMKYRLLHSPAIGTARASRGGMAVLCTAGATACIAEVLVPARSLAVSVLTAARSYFAVSMGMCRVLRHVNVI